MNKYIISPVTTYNFDELLYETKVGLGNKNMDLLFTAHANTEFESRQRACDLVFMLTVTTKEFTVHP